MNTTLLEKSPSTEGLSPEEFEGRSLEGDWEGAVDPPPPPLPIDTIAEELAERNLRLARETEISEDLRLYLEQLADYVSAFTSEAPGEVDPYLLLAAQSALIGALRVLDSPDTAGARREMRTRLEQMRHVFRDIAEGGPLYEDRSAREIARWLATVLDTSQASLAELLGVSARTFQRWISEAGPGEPQGEDARRVRVVAQIANHLRHALTGPGVVRWFARPHPRLGGDRPLDLLDDPQAADLLATLAAGARSHTGS
jgi:uncharacterized protein (DUF2384 family)